MTAPVVNVMKPTTATVPPMSANAPVPRLIWAMSRNISVRYRTTAIPISRIDLALNLICVPTRFQPPTTLCTMLVPTRVAVLRPYHLSSRARVVDGRRDDVDDEQRHERVHDGLVDGI